jgi:hypothetical protein
MRKLVMTLCLMVAALPAWAKTIGPSDAKSYIGQTVTVEGVVSDVFTSHTHTTFVDLGGAYPDNLFTAVIFADDAAKFPNVHAFRGRTVDITGRVTLYHGHPQIILKEAAQIHSR